MDITVSVVNHLDEVNEADYQKLFDQVGATAFYDRRFLRATENAHLLPLEKCYYLLAYQGRELLGFSSVYRQKSPDPFGVLNRTTGLEFDAGKEALLGHIMHSCETDVLAQNDSIYPLMLEALRELAKSEGIKYFGFMNVKNDALLDSARAKDLHVNFMWNRHRVAVDQFESVQDFFSSVDDTRYRKKYRNNWSRYVRSRLALSVESGRYHELHEVADLCLKTTAKYGTASYYPPGPMQSFIEHCGDMAQVRSAQVNGKRFGANIALKDKAAMHLWACGMDYDDAPFSPYFVLISDAIQYAINHKFKWIEMGRTNDELKARMGFSPVPLHSIIGLNEGV